MKLIRVIYITVISFLLASCETIIEINGEDSEKQLVVHALAQTDSVFSALVTHTLQYGAADIFMDKFQDFTGEDRTDLSQCVVSNANVILENSQGTKYTLEFNPQTMTYQSQYVPKAQETLTLSVTAPDFCSIHSKVTVPTKPSFEILNMHKEYDKTSYVYYEGIPWYTNACCEDSLLYLRIKISDEQLKKNYYRLKVRSSYTPSELSKGENFIHHDAFMSDDAIFRDENLTEGYFWWPAYFCNVFDDSAFEGTDYTFTISTRILKTYTNERNSLYGYKPILIIELQQITEDLFYYLKSYLYHRITDESTYSESVYFPTNIEDGWGIFGAINTQKTVLTF